MGSHLNFRDAYHQEIRDEAEHLRGLRAARAWDPIELPGLQRSRPAYALTDRQIEDVARRQAERTICEVIHKHNDERLPD